MFAITTVNTLVSISSAFVRMIIIMCLLLASSARADTSEAKVALIVARGSGVEAMSHRDVRRIYMGLKSVDSTSVKNPVINGKSKELYDEFLKNIMHMTEGSYKRKVVKRIFRQGTGAIPEFTSLKELNEHLLKNVGDVSFVKITSIEKMENVEVVQILW